VLKIHWSRTITPHCDAQGQGYDPSKILIWEPLRSEKKGLGNSKRAVNKLGFISREKTNKTRTTTTIDWVGALRLRGPMVEGM
jgi:hypothetical protein